MTPEGQLKSDLKKILDKIPELELYIPQDTNERGVADVFIFFRGISLIIELKANLSSKNAKEEEPLQRIFLNRMAKAKVVCGVLTETREDFVWNGVYPHERRIEEHYQTLFEFVEDILKVIVTEQFLSLDKDSRNMN